MKPFLKWAGGKTQLLEKINQELPNDINRYSRYVEPFIGAGAVFFKFIKEDKFEEYIINDINEKLINLYIVIRDNLEEFIIEISKLKEEYLALDDVGKSELFYDIRDRFNRNEEGNVKLAVHFLFLNKTAFNGLYRENSKGEFNVPWGKYKNPAFFDEGQLTEISRLLNLKNNEGKYRVKILNRKFEELYECINSKTLVYMDPPYRPVTKGGFNSYNKSSFNDEEQIKLAEFYKRIDKVGAKLMLSNSDPKNLDINDEFFDNLYKGFNIQRVYAKRAINSNGNKRGEITELLITNYTNKLEGEIAMDLENNYSYLEYKQNNKIDELIEIFTTSLLETNRAFDFYVNWERPSEVLEKYKLELNLLNALIRSKNYEEDFTKILKVLPTVVKVLPILFCLAKKDREELWKGKENLKVVNREIGEEDFLIYRFDIAEGEVLTEDEISTYLDFTERIGLKYLFTDLLEQHLVDYVIGCEVGLDTHRRKNEGGKAFELALEPIIKTICDKYGIQLITQKKFKVLREYGFDISEDIENRKADFILIKNKTVMNIEANFYGGAGSKPEEIIDSYINRQQDLKDNSIEFALVTDGHKCWGNDTKSQLLKGFRHLNYLLNYNMCKKQFLEEIIVSIFEVENKI